MENTNGVNEPAKMLEVELDEGSVAAMHRRLEEIRREGFQGTRSRSCVCMHRVPHNLVGVCRTAVQPEIISIGPYHRGKTELLEFESYKWRFLDTLLRRTSSTKGRELKTIYKAMKQLEESTRECFSEFIPMSSADFVEMMLLDGCFVVELLRHVCRSQGVADDDQNDDVLNKPWLVPILIRDLLKLENQLPFFVLETLFDLSKIPGIKGDPLPLLALKFFNHALPRPMEFLKRSKNLEGKHLLDLFLSSFLPNFTPRDSPRCHPFSSQLVHCVTRLLSSGITFKPRKTESFLEINFQNRVLEIPPITVNDLTITFFINCIALEQCDHRRPACFTTYVAFMSSLVNSASDVAFLCADGIVSNFSQSDQSVAEFFRKLGESIVFNFRECYLSKQIGEVESY